MTFGTSQDNWRPEFQHELHEHYVSKVSAEFRQFDGYLPKQPTHIHLDPDRHLYPVDTEPETATTLKFLLHMLIENHAELSDQLGQHLMSHAGAREILTDTEPGNLVLAFNHNDLSDLVVGPAMLADYAEQHTASLSLPNLRHQTTTVVGYPMMSFELGVMGMVVDPVGLLRGVGAVIKTYQHSSKYALPEHLRDYANSLRSLTGDAVNYQLPEDRGNVVHLAPTGTRITSGQLPPISDSTASLFFNRPNTLVLPVNLHAPLLTATGIASKPTHADIRFGQWLEFDAYERNDSTERYINDHTRATLVATALQATMHPLSTQK